MYIVMPLVPARTCNANNSLEEEGQVMKHAERVRSGHEATKDAILPSTDSSQELFHLFLDRELRLRKAHMTCHSIGPTLGV